ncbi:Peroxin 13, N-terminal region-domain-containing protein [Syncephalis plumigaleata]|nr:Peroxin 13, N-terminal region-domain-containing protein [Syncephalis plumigaleata]
MPSPPKPWERAGGESAVANGGGNAGLTASTTNSSMAGVPAAATTGANGPNTMTRPGYYSSGYGNSYGSGYSTGLGSSYGSGYSSYSSPYNRYGMSRYGTGGGLYGSSYGGLSSYGNYGTAYGSYGGYGGGLYGPRTGMYGMGGDPNDPSLMNRMEQSTAGTFHLLESVVGAFGGFAQMLESTYMATHSSFMAMIGVAEHIFALLRTLKRLGYWIIGRQPPVDPMAISVNEFEAHSQRPRISRRPILFFLAAIIGIPWLIGRLIRAADNRRQQNGGNGGGDNSANNPNIPGGAAFNPSELEFARALYDFQGDHAAELTLQRGDLVAILSRHDAQGQPSQWWRGRLRDGRKRSNNNGPDPNNPAGGGGG